MLGLLALSYSLTISSAPPMKLWADLRAALPADVLAELAKCERAADSPVDAMLVTGFPTAPPPCPSFTDMKAAHTKLCAANVIDECWDTYVDGGVLDGVDIEGVCSRSFPTDCNCDGDVDVAGSCAQLESNVKGFFFTDSVCDSRFSRCRGNAPAALVEYCRESLVAAKRLIK